MSRRQGTSDDAGGQFESCPYCHIEALRDQVNLAVFEMPVETDIGIALSERRQDRQHKVYAEGQVHADLKQSGGDGGLARGDGDSVLQPLQIVRNAGEEPFARLGEDELSRRAMEQATLRLRSRVATLRLTAAGVRERRRAAVEKLSASALRMKDSRLARVSKAYFQGMLEYEVNNLRLIRGERKAYLQATAGDSDR